MPLARIRTADPEPEAAAVLAREVASGLVYIAELMLQEHFDLARPGWLPGDYYLGR